MNLNQILSLFDGQGIVFWSAVTAVTLGLTMLSVAIVFQVRKMLKSRTLGFVARNQMKTAPENTPEAGPRITVTDEGYRADGFVPAVPAPASSDPLLSSLLERLQTSADRLERIHVSLGQGSGGRKPANDSVLKAAGDEVDYVYQAGRLGTT